MAEGRRTSCELVSGPCGSSPQIVQWRFRWKEVPFFLLNGVRVPFFAGHPWSVALEPWERVQGARCLQVLRCHAGIESIEFITLGTLKYIEDVRIEAACALQPILGSFHRDLSELPRGVG